ncbi:MAG: 2-amino-4-hydroxy-6-hydroxymethyldihydropteridine diphosphokinase [Anaerolineales bacterium]
MAQRVYLALGTNIGDRPANLRAALDAFAPDVIVKAESPVYETQPWGYTDQPAFLNMVVYAETDLSPLELLTHLKALEQTLGRVPSFRNGPRLIDLDILFYDDLMLDAPPLALPHPRLHERAFVLVPLADLAPGLVHPRLGRSVGQLLETVDRRGVRLFVGLGSPDVGLGSPDPSRRVI